MVVLQFTVFLAARSVSSSTAAQQAMNGAWNVLEELPVYRQLKAYGDGARQLMRYLRTHPDETDDMLASGSRRNLAMTKWLDKLEGLSDELRIFRRDTAWMLDAYFEELPSRLPREYSAAYGRYRRDKDNEMAARLEEQREAGDISELLMPVLSFPVRLSFAPAVQAQGGRLMLAEEMIFEDLPSFLYTDLYRGMAAGNIPRRCHHCCRFFLVTGGYDTVYCEKIAPGEQAKTCRQVGAHRKEARQNGTDFIRKEYQRVYNRLKARKRYGSISPDEWNRQVAVIQNLADQAKRGQLSEVELKQRLDEV